MSVILIYCSFLFLVLFYSNRTDPYNPPSKAIVYSDGKVIQSKRIKLKILTVNKGQWMLALYIFIDSDQTQKQNLLYVLSTMFCCF